MELNGEKGLSRHLGFLGIIGLLVLWTITANAAASVTLMWDPSPEATVTGYALRYGTNSGNHTQLIDNGIQTICTVAGLTEGVTYFFVVTAYAATGVESLPSNEASYAVPSVVVPNQPPAVIAGANQSATLPATVSLQGTVTDDGLPLPASLSATWSVISGPGSVTFQDAHAPATTASFFVAGDYTLRLTASDGALASFSDLNVTVSPQPVLDTAPGISSLTMTPAGPMLTWTSVPDRTYRVVFKESLDATQWSDASPDMAATGDTLTWVDTTAVSSNQRFYSVALLP